MADHDGVASTIGETVAEPAGGIDVVASDLQTIYSEPAGGIPPGYGRLYREFPRLGREDAE